MKGPPPPKKKSSSNIGNSGSGVLITPCPNLIGSSSSKSSSFSCSTTPMKAVSLVRTWYLIDSSTLNSGSLFAANLKTLRDFSSETKVTSSLVKTRLIG